MNSPESPLQTPKPLSSYFLPIPLTLSVPRLIAPVFVSSKRPLFLSLFQFAQHMMACLFTRVLLCTVECVRHKHKARTHSELTPFLNNIFFFSFFYFFSPRSLSFAGLEMHQCWKCQRTKRHPSLDLRAITTSTQPQRTWSGTSSTSLPSRTSPSPLTIQCFQESRSLTSSTMVSDTSTWSIRNSPRATKRFSSASALQAIFT